MIRSGKPSGARRAVVGIAVGGVAAAVALAPGAARAVVARAVVGDPVAGKQVFEQAGCASCHTLKAAGAKGTVGPNLDQAKPSFDRVVLRVTNGQGVMPSFKGSLTAKQISDVAAFVSAPGSATPPAQPPAASTTVRVTVREWQFAASTRRVTAGIVTFVVSNTGTIPHRLVVLRSDQLVARLAVSGGRAAESGRVGAITARAKQTVRLTLRLGKGRYVLICNEKGHYRRHPGAVLAAAAPSAPAPTPAPTGRTLFQTFCAGCHTLADAKTTGTRGPNLDREKPDCEDVLEAMRGAKPEMPTFAGSVTAAQMQLIASYVARVTGGDANNCG